MKNPLNHVAFIMDGNGRWGLKNKNSRNAGHKEGLKTIEAIINTSIKNRIKFITLFMFSVDNWKRPKKEISYLFNLLEIFLKKNFDKINKKNIKLKILGEKKIPLKLKKILIRVEKNTNKNTNLQINLAINYSGRAEIINSIKKIIFKRIPINEKNLSNNLYTKNIPDPDILIRTGNTKRLSNFLLWQLSYTEIFFIKKLWPDFRDRDFINIIRQFKKIKRNFGSI